MKHLIVTVVLLMAFVACEEDERTPTDSVTWTSVTTGIVEDFEVFRDDGTSKQHSEMWGVMRFTDGREVVTPAFRSDRWPGVVVPTGECTTLYVKSNGVVHSLMRVEPSLDCDPSDEGG